MRRKSSGNVLPCRELSEQVSIAAVPLYFRAVQTRRPVLPSQTLSARTQAHVFLSAPNEAKEPRRQGASFRIVEQRPAADDASRGTSSPRGVAH